MSKLRADITWKHHINSHSVITPVSIIDNIEEDNYISDCEDENIDKNEVENSDDNDEKNENNEKNNENEEKENNNLEKEFNDYLQGWAEMLKEETERFEDEEYEAEDILETTNNIIHPAVNSNAKWKLELLFKDLKFPFND
jgi:hypothetical protein